MLAEIAMLASIARKGQPCQTPQTQHQAVAFVLLGITARRVVQRLFRAQEAHILDHQVDPRCHRVYQHLLGTI
jgi:hypothetical protein